MFQTPFLEVQSLHPNRIGTDEWTWVVRRPVSSTTSPLSTESWVSTQAAPSRPGGLALSGAPAGLLSLEPWGTAHRWTWIAVLGLLRLKEESQQGAYEPPVCIRMRQFDRSERRAVERGPVSLGVLSRKLKHAGSRMLQMDWLLKPCGLGDRGNAVSTLRQTEKKRRND